MQREAAANSCCMPPNNTHSQPSSANSCCMPPDTAHSQPGGACVLNKLTQLLCMLRCRRLTLYGSRHSMALRFDHQCNQHVRGHTRPHARLGARTRTRTPTHGMPGCNTTSFTQPCTAVPKQSLHGRKQQCRSPHPGNTRPTAHLIVGLWAVGCASLVGVCEGLAWNTRRHLHGNIKGTAMRPCMMGVLVLVRCTNTGDVMSTINPSLPKRGAPQARTGRCAGAAAVPLLLLPHAYCPNTLKHAHLA